MLESMIEKMIMQICHTERRDEKFISYSIVTNGTIFESSFADKFPLKVVAQIFSDNWANFYKCHFLGKDCRRFFLGNVWKI